MTIFLIQCSLPCRFLIWLMGQILNQEDDLDHLYDFDCKGWQLVSWICRIEKLEHILYDLRQPILKPSKETEKIYV